MIRKLYYSLPIKIQTFLYSYLKKGRADLGKGTYIHHSVHMLGKNNIKVGSNSCISQDVWFNVNHRTEKEISIAIGSNCFIGRNNFFTSGRLISISDYTLTAIGCKFIGSTHIIDNPLTPYLSSSTSNLDEIRVGVNCFLGAGVTLLGNIKIGHGSVIGADSLVINDIPPFSIAVGNPAKVIKNFSFIKNKWLSRSCMTEKDFRSMPSEAVYFKLLKTNFNNLNMPWIAAGKDMGDL